MGVAGEIELRQAGRLVVNRMTRVVDAAAGEVARKVSGKAGVLAHHSGNTRDTGGDTGRVLEGTIVGGAKMYGVGLSGRRIQVDPDRVVVRPLHNDHGEVVGLRIPANFDDARAAARWADGQLLGHFTNRVPVLSDADHKRASSLVEDWDANPFFVVGRFRALDTEVMLDHGTGAEPVRLGGTEFGHLIARRPEFDEMIDTIPGSRRPVVLVTQGSGVADPKLVESIAGYLHSHTDLIGPVRGVVHPTTRLEQTRSGAYLPYPELEAHVTLDASYQPTSEYLEYRHPGVNREP